MSRQPTNTKDSGANLRNDFIGVSPGVAGELGLTFAGNYNPKRETAKDGGDGGQKSGIEGSEAEDLPFII